MNATEAEIARLERRFGARWQIWVVYRAVGGVIWCARPWGAGDDATQTINAATPEELEEMLAAADG